MNDDGNAFVTPEASDQSTQGAPAGKVPKGITIPSAILNGLAANSCASLLFHAIAQDWSHEQRSQVRGFMFLAAIVISVLMLMGRRLPAWITAVTLLTGSLSIATLICIALPQITATALVGPSVLMVLHGVFGFLLAQRLMQMRKAQLPLLR